MIITLSLRDVSMDKRLSHVNGMPVATDYAVFIIFPISPDMFSCYGDGEFWINFLTGKEKKNVTEILKDFINSIFNNGCSVIVITACICCRSNSGG